MTDARQNTGNHPDPLSEVGYWHPITDQPPVGSKIIALYADGSGSTMLLRHDGGFIDQDGYDWEYGELSDHYTFWTLLPPAFKFWWETRAEEKWRKGQEP
jgi:hypothetical protein